MPKPTKEANRCELRLETPNAPTKALWVVSPKRLRPLQVVYFRGASSEVRASPLGLAGRSWSDHVAEHRVAQLGLEPGALGGHQAAGVGDSLPSGLLQDQIFAGLDSRDGSVQLREMLLKRGAVVRPEFENRNAPGREVLLTAEVLVRHNEQDESGLFRGVEQLAVAEAPPPHALGRGDFVVGQRVADLERDALVEEDPHQASSLSIRCQPWRTTAAACSRVTVGKVSRK